MAKVGIKNLTWAKYASGGEGSAITYTGGTMAKDYMVRAELTIDNSNDQEFADNHLIDTEASPTGVHLALELADMTGQMMQDFLGMVADQGGTVYSLTDQAAGYLGVGYMMVNRFKGVVTYEGVWIHKALFHRDSLSADTKTTNVTFSHENVTGDGVGVQLAAGAAVVYVEHMKGGATEAAVETWLKGKAGIS